MLACAAGRRAIKEKLHINMRDARWESETALNVSIQHVLDRTGLKPSQVSYPGLICSPATRRYCIALPCGF